MSSAKGLRRYPKFQVRYSLLPIGVVGMTRSHFSRQARQQAMAQLRRCLRWSLPGSLIFHGLLVLGWGFFGQWSAPLPPAPETEIELVAESAPDVPPTAAIDKTAGGGGGGGGNFRLDVLNPQPGEEPGGETAIAVLPSVAAAATRDATASARVSPEPVNPATTGVPEPGVSATPEGDAAQQSPRPSTPSAPKTSPVNTPITGTPAAGANQGAQGTNSKTQATGTGTHADGKPGSSWGRGAGQGNGQGAGRGPGIGGPGSRGGGVGQGQGAGTGNRSGPGRDQATPTPPAKLLEPPVARAKPLTASPARQRPKCTDNCGRPEFFGKEGSAQFDFDIDARGNPVNIRLKESSGDLEIDQKAAEQIRRRRYEASDEGYQGAKLRVTSERAGSDFQRQQEQRRQEAIAAQAQQERDRRAQPQAHERESAQPPLPVERPVEQPIEPPVESPPVVAPAPIAPTEPAVPPTSVSPDPASAPAQPAATTPLPLEPVEPPPATDSPSAVPIAPPLVEPSPIEPLPVEPSPVAAPVTPPPAVTPGP